MGVIVIPIPTMAEQYIQQPNIPARVKHLQQSALRLLSGKGIDLWTREVDGKYITDTTVIGNGLVKLRMEVDLEFVHPSIPEGPVDVLVAPEVPEDKSEPKKQPQRKKSVRGKKK